MTRTMSWSGGAFVSLSLAIVRGFVRDKASVFFAIVFPLMFLVLFGASSTTRTSRRSR